MVHDHADATPLLSALRYRSVPFLLCKPSSELGKARGSSFDAVGKQLGAAALKFAIPRGTGLWLHWPSKWDYRVRVLPSDSVIFWQ